MTVDQGQIGLVAVRDGAGLMYVAEPMVRKDLRDGTLRTVLEEWRPSTPAFTSITRVDSRFRPRSGFLSISSASCGRSASEPEGSMNPPQWNIR
jgi:DNA-binding transcriptional LysR family regulator